MENVSLICDGPNTPGRDTGDTIPFPRNPMRIEARSNRNRSGISVLSLIPVTLFRPVARYHATPLVPQPPRRESFLECDILGTIRACLRSRL